MTGWLLIIFLLVLGGILSTLGDFIGTKIGKARLSIFKLRPRRTAVLITILTGSFISSLSLSLILLVDRQLRVGLFRLNDLQTELNNSRSDLLSLRKQRKILEDKITKREKYLAQSEKIRFALRKRPIVIASGEPLATVTLQITDKSKIKKEIDKVLSRANYNAYKKIRPKEKPNRKLLQISKDDYRRIEEMISDQRKWVLNIRSGGNVFLGEEVIFAYPEILLDKKIVEKGEVIAIRKFLENQNDQKIVDREIQLLLTSTLAEVKRRGSLVYQINVDTESVSDTRKKMINNKKFLLEVISLKDSQLADRISVKVAFRKIYK